MGSLKIMGDNVRHYHEKKYGLTAWVECHIYPPTSDDRGLYL